MDKLTEIMAHKRREIAPFLRPIFSDELIELNKSLPKPPSFLQALRRSDRKLAVIAEIKRRSPSAGAIKENVSALDQARLYLRAGASALSILTDEKYFGGTLADLQSVTSELARLAKGKDGIKPIPCLRKDFMVHPVQVLQARQAGASAILIIVRALSDEEIDSIQKAATAAGLDALYEIHTHQELKRALAHKAKIIGINNRDLAIFKTNLDLSENLLPHFPKNVVAVSESGFATGTDAARVKKAGAHAILVGESLMRAPDPAAIIRDFHDC